MSYPGNTTTNHQHSGDGAIAVVTGAIIMGNSGPTTQFVGTIGQANMGETNGPNSVNPSGTPSGIRNARQNNFRNTRRR